LKITISGAGGFIGKALSEYFKMRNHSVYSLSRKSIAMPLAQLANLLEDTDIIINLSGSPIIGRWTHSTKKSIYDSRVLTTRKISAAIRIMRTPPGLFISGSAIGIYKSKGSHTENSVELSGGFLGKVCRDWEDEAIKTSGKTRVIIVRTGVVLGKNGGALARMLPIFRSGLGGIIASGRQGFSWIHLDDLLEVFNFLVSEKELRGTFNLTAPQPVDNRTFTRQLSRTLQKRSFIPVPAFILRLIYGEGAITLIEGQTAIPERLIHAGFKFKFGDLESALSDLLSPDKPQ
jgi:uncharacterized protein